MIKALFTVCLLATCADAAGASEMDSGSCDLQLARLIVDTPRTALVDGESKLYSAMSRYRFLEHATRQRPMASTTRPRREPGEEEFIFHLAIREMGLDHLQMRSDLVIRFFEEKVRYDRDTGQLDQGYSAGTAVRPLGVRFRFSLANFAYLDPYHLRGAHDDVVPRIQSELDAMNEVAEQKFRRRLMAPLQHMYPGEYETELAPEITPEELAFLIEALANQR